MDQTEPTARRARSIRGSGPHADVTVGAASPPEAGSDTTSGAPTDGSNPRAVEDRDAICDAILDLFAERSPVTLDAVAARAGLAPRTIYRRFADLDAAVAHAQDLRLAAVFEMWGRQDPPSPALALEERVEIMLDQRFELERFGRPMRFTRQEPNPDVAFDAHVLEAFAPELTRFDDERRERVGLVVAWALRPRAIRSHLDSQSDEALARATIRATLLEALRD